MKVRLLVIGLAATFVAADSAFADDYYLAPGASETLATAATYGSMGVEGNLTVSAVAISCNNICLTGGTVRVTGKNARIGDANKGTSKWYATNDVNGAATTFVADDSGKLGFGRLELRFDDAKLPVKDGEFQFLALTNGIADIRQVFNYSSYTARIDVAGSSSKISRPGDWSGSGAFSKGAFHIRLADGASLVFDPGNQMGNIADDGVAVRFDGNGDIRVNCDNYDNASYPFNLRPGTVFDNAGTVTFSSTDNAIGGFYFLTGDTFGPNVTKLIGAASGYTRLIYATKGVEVKLPPVTELPASHVSLVGSGSFLLDASDRDVSFEGTMAPAANSPLALRKIGACEATVASTNLLNVKVEAGTLRFVRLDCTVADLIVAADAEVVVDGCTLTLRPWQAISGSRVRTVNGGRIAVDGSANGYVYDPSLQGDLHVTGGDVVLSGQGLTNKYVRLTFSSMQGKPAPLGLRNVFLFGSDHTWENKDLKQAKVDPVYTAETLEDLAAGKARYVISSSTNMAYIGKEGWQDYHTFEHMFRVKDNGNNYPTMTSPVIDAANPDSWVSLDMHLNDDAQPIVGYNLGIVTAAFKDPFCYPDAWRVSVSDDGYEWTEIERREGVVCREVASKAYYYYYTYDGTKWDDYQKSSDEVVLAKVPAQFRLSGYRRDGLKSVGPMTLEIDPGASIDFTAFTAGAQVVSGLAVDAAVGGGMLKGGVLAESGRVDLRNLDYDAQGAISFDFVDVEGVGNLANWTVTGNGLELPGCTVSYDAEAKKLVLSSVFVHIAESGSGSLQALAPGKSFSVLVDPGVVFTNTTALAGAACISKTGAGKIVFAAESPDYTGDLAVDEGVVEGVVSNAFGRGTLTLHCSTVHDAQVVLGSASANTAYDNDFVFSGDSSSAYQSLKFVTSGLKATVVAGDVTVRGTLVAVDSANPGAQSKDLVSFAGRVDAVGSTIDYKCDNNVRWKGPLLCDQFVCLCGYPAMGSHFFHSSENAIGRIRFDYNSLRLAGDDVLGGAVLEFAGSSTEGQSRGSVFLNGYSETAAYLESTTTSTGNRLRNFDNDLDSTGSLTLTGGVSEVSACVNFGMLGAYQKKFGRCSLVVDAGNDDFVQVLTNSTCSTFGTFAVKNGTLRLAGASTITNVPSIAVEGGAFELESTVAEAMKSVTNVTLGAGARLRVAASATAAFGANPKTVLRLTKSSSLDLPAGAEVTVWKARFVEGIPIAAGVYTSADLPQIDGGGTLRVLSGGGLTVLIR